MSTLYRAARWQFIEQKFAPFGPARETESQAAADVWGDRDESGKDIGRYSIIASPAVRSSERPTQ